MKPRIKTSLFSFFTPLRLLFFFLVVPVLILTLVLLFTIENTPITRDNIQLTHKDIQNVLKTINKSSLKEQKTLKLSEKNLNIALSYLLNHYLHSTSKITVEQKQLDFKIALLLSNNYFRKYLNFNFKLTKQDGYPIINQLKIGKIGIADKFAGQILEKIIKHTPLKEYYILAAQHTKDINISRDRFLTVSYIPPSDIDLKNKLSLNNRNFQSILLYQHQITIIIAQHNPKWRLSLAELFQPLFKQAYQRSTPETATSENRAVLIAISTYVNKSEIQTYIPFDISPSTQKQYPASLYKRPDMAKHFMASAVLAATGAETLATMLGQHKELDDAKHGSGFSFIDLAGDRAGLKFGKMAVTSPAKARKLQYIISNIKDYKSFMPEVRDLPENMNDIEFKNNFESISSEKYQDMLSKIDKRISSLFIYQ
ncbi:MAG: hypothetical protein KAH20_16120 [Methylococcales bacterium]|nr:hypothetical protein [Methylococcales bacterium]